MSERILLVEPEASVTQLITRELEAAGMEVISTRDPQTACVLLESQPAELVLIGSDLYSSGGLDLVASLRRLRRFSRLPVIILGSPEGSSENVRWLEAGADSTIPPLCSPAVLVARLRALLRRAGQNNRVGTERH